jgi:periplasmic protein TonB
LAESRLYRPQKRRRWGVMALVALAHAAALFGLGYVFAPDFTSRAIDAATSVMTVNIISPEPDAPPSPEPDEGTSGEAGDRATPRPTSAPEVNIPVRSDPSAPRASSTGRESRSGASAGEGTGGAEEGVGTGAGNSGAGQGSGIATTAVKIAGDINSAADYPIPQGGRETRIGKAVTIAITVGADGSPKACRVHRSSGLPETDARTCELAMARFRFRPAMNAAGDPVQSIFGWEQRFFD